jgi:type II secretory pathway component PulF
MLSRKKKGAKEKNRKKNKKNLYYPLDLASFLFIYLFIFMHVIILNALRPAACDPGLLK